MKGLSPRCRSLLQSEELSPFVAGRKTKQKNTTNKHEKQQQQNRCLLYVLLPIENATDGMAQFRKRSSIGMPTQRVGSMSVQVHLWRQLSHCTPLVHLCSLLHFYHYNSYCRLHL